MLRHLPALAALAFLVAAPAFAQTPAPVSPAAPVLAPAPAPATPAAPAMTKDGKPRMKEVRMQCRDETKAANLKGDARKQAMADCIVKQRPDMADRVKCQMDPSLKGMDKDARREAVKACVAKTKG